MTFSHHLKAVTVTDKQECLQEYYTTEFFGGDGKKNFLI